MPETVMERLCILVAAKGRAVPSVVQDIRKLLHHREHGALVESTQGIFLEGSPDTEMNLRDVVNKYLAIAGGCGRPAALADFGLDPAQTERLFSAFDEDYHISRFFHFTKSSGAAYRINGFDHTHVSIDAEIETIF